jgi:hypothetical protein
MKAVHEIVAALGRPTRRSLLSALFLFQLWVSCGAGQNAEPADAPVRPPSWARPIALEGALNLHLVDENFYRSAQPDANGFKALAKQLGVRTVISLRAFNSDRPLTRGLDMRLARFPIHTLRLATRQGPTLLHCQHGADRTHT